MTEPSSSLKSMNGHINGQMSSKYQHRLAGEKQRNGFLPRLFSIAARLAIWGVIFTILFRCPSSLEVCDHDSPCICKPYFQIKQIASPHVQPYYDHFASPYVEAGKPYYNAVDRTVLKPVRLYVVQYGTPWLDKGQQKLSQQWHKNVQPQLFHVQAQAQKQYDRIVAPYLTKASETAMPYYEIARTNGLQMYYEGILPSYRTIQPYLTQGYILASGFTTDTAVPAIAWSWNKISVFVDATVWPHLRAVYYDNVEPQLVRIGERLGRYKTKVKPSTASSKAPASKPARDGGHSSFNKPTPQSLSTTFSAQSSKSITTGTPSARKRQQHLNVEFAASSTETEKKKTTEMVAEDIELWKKKFAAQADEGASAMEEIIGEISKRMIETYVAAMGKSLVDDFEKTVKSEIDSLKLKTLSFVDDSERPISDVEAVVLEDIRSAGIRIRDKAQRIRAWRAEYDKELQNSVFGAADTHLKILDEARSLALQHIGMKWAWTEGITHKDWVKYHELKDTFAECTENLKEIIASYPALLEAQDASARVEDEAMELASAAAKELTRLKEVAQYKILARDTSDNFETEAMRVAAQVAQEAKEDEKLLAEKIETFKDAISEDLSENSEAVIEAHGNGEASVNDFTVSVESGLESAATVAADNTSGQSSVPSQNPSHILHVHIQGEFALNSLRDDSLGATEMDGVPRSASEAERTGGLAVSDGFNSAQRDLSASCETGDSMESSSTPVAYDNRSDTGPSLAYEASETILGATQTMVGNLTDMTPVSVQGNEIDVDDYFQDEESSDESPAAETTATKPALFGAAAEFVPDRQPILEDYVDTDRICEAASMTYSSAVALAAEQYSSAASVVSAQVSGTPGPVHAKLFSSISNAYGDAVAKASDNFRDAVDAASRGMFGTPTETARTSLVDWAKVESIAAQRLNEGRLWAEVQYESAMVAMGMATPTPTSHADRMYQQAKHNYYAGLGMAQDHYSSFIAAASSAMHSMTATPTPTDFAGTASSMTSAAQISAASVVGAAREAASSAYSAAGAAVEQAGEAIDDYIASASLAVADSMQLAGGALAESWNNVVASLSSEVYGQPTPIAWHDQVADVDVEAATFSAAQKYEAVKMLVSELISGKEPTFTESVLSRLGAVYSTATASGASVLSEVSAAASSFGDKVGSAASQATDAAKDSVRQAKDEL